MPGPARPGTTPVHRRGTGGPRRRLDDVNAYLREVAGEEFTAKDFRTYRPGPALQEFEAFDSQVQAKKTSRAGDRVGGPLPGEHAERLPEVLHPSRRPGRLPGRHHARAAASLSGERGDGACPGPLRCRNRPSWRVCCRLAQEEEQDRSNCAARGERRRRPADIRATARSGDSTPRLSLTLEVTIGGPTACHLPAALAQLVERDAFVKHRSRVRVPEAALDGSPKRSPY